MKTLEELKDWDTYRAELKVALGKIAEGATAPFCVAKDKLDFSVKGSAWTGRLVLVGALGEKQARQLTAKEGLKFVVGSCHLEGSTLHVTGIDGVHAAAAEVALKKAALGYGCDFPAEAAAPATPAPTADMARVQAALQRLTPAVKAAVQEDPGRKTELLAPLLAAQKAIEAGEAEAAQRSVLELASLLKNGVGAPAGSGPEARAEGSIKLYRDALAAVDGQISALQGVLRQAGDPELMEIADKGLNAITSGHKVKLQAALMEFRGAKGAARKPAAAKVAGLAEDFASFLDEDPRVEALDTNPSDTRVAVRGTLGPALARLAKTMESLGA